MSTHDNWDGDIKRTTEILEKTDSMEKTEIEALIGMLKLRRNNIMLDKAVLESILRENKNLKDESMKKTRKDIMAVFNSTKKGGAKRKRRRKTKRKSKRKKRRKTRRKRKRRKTRRKRRKMRGGG